jgi:hypothetical protein
LYMMAMTTDHIIMATADTVFVKHSKSKKNVEFSRSGDESAAVSKNDDGEQQRHDSKDHPVRVREGIMVYKDATLAELQRFDKKTRGASFVLQPFSKLSWSTTLFRRFGWKLGFSSPTKN